ncbi:MAG: alpha/beta fold hydrolase [Patescibacteria group bacterium]
MEKKLKIKVSEKNYIYGRLSGSSRQPLFIVVHGLPGSMDEDFYLNATRWFVKRGYASFRFNLYGTEKNSRQMMDSTLKTHASDIDAAVRYFRGKKFQKIFIAGHSYGGPSILLSSEQKFDGAVLWDPSYKVSFTKTQHGFPAVKYIKEIKGYIMNWGTNLIVGKAMADEANTINWNELTKNFHLPLRIIAAGKGHLVRGAKHYFRTANDPKELTVIKDATHYFNDTEDMREKVFKISEDWFKKISNR